MTATFGRIPSGRACCIILMCISARMYSASAQDTFPYESVETAVQQAHAELWSRFIDPYGVILDYTDLDGSVIIPTPEECRIGKPNAFAWWIPTENGAFFNGLYLDALCNKWRITKDAETAREARIIAGGLVKLAEVARTPGFIARGISTDGVSHHAASSDDQTFPWFYGLWKYIQSGLPAPEERASIIQVMLRTAKALESYGWRMPCEDPMLGFRGRWDSDNFVHATRLLFVVRIMHELTGDAHWRDLYQAYVRATPNRNMDYPHFDPALESTGTRLATVVRGVPYGSPGEKFHPFWTSASSQAGLRVLYELEENPYIKDRYRQALSANAAKAAEHITRYNDYDNKNTIVFSPDWRPLNELWIPQAHVDSTLALAQRQLRVWQEMSPRKRYELMNMMEPLFAAWVIVLSDDREVLNTSLDGIRAMLRHYDWSRLYYSGFFMAECVYYEGRINGLE